MKVAVHSVYKSDRKEPFGVMLRRLIAAFETAGLDPSVTASFSDSPLAEGVSAVDRAAKRFPAVPDMVASEPVFPGVPAARRITNAGSGEPFPGDLLLALGDGLPRSLPFHSVTVVLGHREFGDLATLAIGVPAVGVIAGDSWWVNGRNRSLNVVHMIDGATDARSLPAPSPAVSAILAALGKPKKTTQIVLGSTAPSGVADAPPIPALSEIVARYRAEMPGFLERLDFPHAFPRFESALGSVGGSGPLKPALTAAFAPRGFDCRGESGMFTLRRRTPANHTVALVFDVGTWSRMVTAVYKIQGPGFEASLPLPAGDLSGRQYPIGDTANWERIIANLAVVVDALDGSFLPEIESVAGPAPEWFQPG